MKSYNRETGKYITNEEKGGKLKKRELCKGGRQHDWVKVLPFGYEASEAYEGDVEPLYQALEAIADFEDATYDVLKQIGIVKTHKAWRPRPERVLMCSVCKKKKYE